MSARLGFWIVGGATSVVSVLQAQDSFESEQLLMLRRSIFRKSCHNARFMYSCLGPFTAVDLAWLKRGVPINLIRDYRMIFMSKGHLFHDQSGKEGW